MQENHKNVEQSHFDQWVSGKGSEVIFYDTPFLQNLLRDIENFAIRSLGNMTKKKLLFYGCGINLKPVKIFLDGGAAFVDMIDISPKSIKAVSIMTKKIGIDNQTHPIVMDCEDLIYGNNTF